MGDRYEEIAANAVRQHFGIQGFGDAIRMVPCDPRELAADIASALREQDRWYAIDDPEHPAPEASSDELEVIVWGGVHTIPRVMGADGEWWRLRRREGSKNVPTHWRPMPPPPDTGRDTVTPRDTGGGDG